MSSPFLTLIHQDLVGALKSELGGLFENLIVALLTPPALYDASQLHKALKVTNNAAEFTSCLMSARTLINTAVPVVRSLKTTVYSSWSHVL